MVRRQRTPHRQQHRPQPPVPSLHVPPLVRPHRRSRPRPRRSPHEPGQPAPPPPRLYGKVQGTYPARWLTHEQAYDQLAPPCDDSDVGLRDELLLRLGLAGMRAAEIIDLQLGTSAWTTTRPASTG